MGTAVDSAYCGACGQPSGQGDHARCAGLLRFDPPRFCGTCGFRLDVQVYPGGVESSCRRCARPARKAR